jgi:transcriptional regulator with PAS, ATPase and Fis domain
LKPGIPMAVALGRADSSGLTDLAVQIRALSAAAWGEHKATNLVGRHPSLLEAQRKLLQFARAEAPVLITGETGTGKEVFARALYLLSARRHKPFFSINCAQYHDGQLLGSELFGHKRGSFTGAIADHRGVFEEANGGIVFLDEVGELSLPAQAMLLRALSEGEIQSIGDTRPRTVDVRVLAATGRSLRAMIEAGTFREDLYYRLRFLQIPVPPLRQRGEDLELLLDFWLAQLSREQGISKLVSEESRRTLRDYHFPGNVRELKGLIATGYYVSESAVIERAHFEGEMEQPIAAARDGIDRSDRRDASSVRDRYERMIMGQESFWDVVHAPFMDRELNRREGAAIVSLGLAASQGSYKRLLELFHIAPDDYLRFMDVLRHHRLKPTH